MSTTVNVEVVWYIFFEYPEEIKFGLVFYVIFGKPLLLLFFGGGGINNYLDELLS